MMEQPIRADHSARTIAIVLTMLLALSLVPLTNTSATAGGTYYVAKSGSDTNSGTETRPFLTLNHATEAAGPGDTVYVKSGTYNERLTITTVASAGSPLTFKAFGNDKVSIADGIKLRGAHIKIDGFNISQLTDVSSIQDRIVSFDGARYCEVSNVRIVADWGSTVFINGASHNVFRDSDSTGGSAPSFYVGSSNNLVENSRFEGIAKGASIGGSANTLQDSYVRGSGNGTDLYYPHGDGNTVRRTMIYGFTRPEGSSAHTDLFQIWSGSLTDFTVEDNILGSNHVTPWGSKDPDNRHFMFSSDDSQISTVTIRNNVILGGGSHAGTIGGANPIVNFQIYNNLFFNGLGGSLGTHNRRDWLVTNNIFVGAGVDGPGDGSAVWDNNIYRNMTLPTYEGAGVGAD